jgi:hypothetical protein
MEAGNSVKEELKVWIYYEIIRVSQITDSQVLTYEEINSVLIDILHENNQHDPKEQFKKVI